MVGQRKSLYLPPRCKIPCPSAPGLCLCLSCPFPATPCLPIRILTLCSLTHSLGHCSKGECSYTSLGHFVEKTGNSKAGTILFSCQTSMKTTTTKKNTIKKHKQTKNPQQQKHHITQNTKTKKTSWFHKQSLSQVIPTSVSVFIGPWTRHHFHNQEKKIKPLIHILEGSLFIISRNKVRK